MGLDDRDIGVFIFLLTHRWYEKNSVFSASEVVKKLNSISSMLPEQFRTKYSPKSAGNSLTKLTTLGFVVECENHKKNRSGGRPAEILYEAAKFTSIRESIIEILNNYKQGILNAISPLEAMEEAISLREGGTLRDE